MGKHHIENDERPGIIGDDGPVRVSPPGDLAILHARAIRPPAAGHGEETVRTDRGRAPHGTIHRMAKVEIAILLGIPFEMRIANIPHAAPEIDAGAALRNSQLSME